VMWDARTCLGTHPGRAFPSRPRPRRVARSGYDALNADGGCASTEGAVPKGLRRPTIGARVFRRLR
jgi:hypothetical protein